MVYAPHFRAELWQWGREVQIANLEKNNPKVNLMKIKNDLKQPSYFRKFGNLLLKVFYSTPLSTYN